MKPMYEKVLPTENSSWRYWLYALDEIPFSWHYHPEYEICLTLNSRGQRFIGEQIANYDDFDCVLLGPKLPHTWSSKELIEPGQHLTYVAQLPTKWLDTLIQQPEFFGLKELLEKSKFGVEFTRKTAEQAYALFQKMDSAAPLQRLIYLFEMLMVMLADSHAKVICNNDYAPTIFPDSATEKIDKVIAYIHEHYTEDIRAEEVAQLVHMSTNHFHHFFKKRTEQTLTELVNKLRVGKACSMLLNTDLSIAIIGERSGFNNPSNFNRRFMQIKGCTPREFRYQVNNAGTQNKNTKTI